MPMNFKIQDGNRLIDLEDVLVKREDFSEGNVWVWGWNNEGQLGNNSTTYSMDVPINPAPNIATCKSINGGGSFLSIVKTDGTAWAWGSNDNGQIGNFQQGTDKSTPVQIGTSNQWIKTVCGVNFQFLLKNDGTLWACGDNSSGQLGDNSSFGLRAGPVQCVGENYKNVFAGQATAAAIKSDGSLWTWGWNGSGVLGINSISQGVYSSPVQVGTDTNWKTVAVGLQHMIAIKTDGSLWSWGINSNGCLGQNLSSASLSAMSSPVQIGTSYDWKTPAAGYDFSAAVKHDGTAWVWGKNQVGQLAIDPYGSDFISPVQMDQSRDWKKIVLGQNGSCGLKVDGTIWYWGLNSSHTNSTSRPVQIESKTNWKDIDTHGSNTTIAMTDPSI